MTKTKWWVSTDLIGKPGSPKTAGPFSTREDAFAARQALEAIGANLSVFEEEATPAVDLPTDEALGWATVRAPHWTSDTVLLRHWEVEGSHLRCAVAPMYLVDHITSFTPAVAVPKAALDELRSVGERCDATYPNYAKAIETFLAAIDAANGDPR